jgi:putative tryptophan/tyrosine transport system substrate-binding protein
MRRRAFITLLGGAAVAWPLAGRAQQRPAIPVIGFLSSASPRQYADRVRAFHRGLNEAGYADGQNVAIEYRWAEDDNNQLPALAAQLVQRQVTVIVAAGATPSALAAKSATSTIPIVFGIGADPIEVGLISSLNRPGGNLTGITTLALELGPKRLELLHELVPAATHIAVLNDPTGLVNAEAVSREQTAARKLGLVFEVLHASSEPDFERVFATLVRSRAGALLIRPHLLFTAHGAQLGALALGHAVPAIFQYRPFVTAGGLMSYGTSETQYFRLLGDYAARILKGEKPADVPVQQVTNVELMLNLKTAQALGLEIPPTLLARADEVIE